MEKKISTEIFEQDGVLKKQVLISTGKSAKGYIEPVNIVSKREESGR